MQLSRFPAGESSLRQNARDVSETDTLSLSLPSSPRCRDIVVTAIASEREALAKEDRDAVHEYSYHDASPRLSVFLLPQQNPRRRSIDRARSILPNETHSGFTDPTRKRGGGGSFLVDRMNFSLFPLSPFYRFVPLYVVMKGIMKGSRSLPLTRSVLLFPLPRGEEIPSLLVPLPRSTVFVRPRGSPPVAGSVYINV